MTDARLDRHGDPLPPHALARVGTVRWKHPGGDVNDLAFSRDGRALVSAGDGLARWDLATGRTAWSVESGDHASCAVFEAGGRPRVVTVGFSGDVRLVDGDTGEALATLHHHARLLVAVAASPDGRLVAAGGFDRYGVVLDASDGAVRATLAPTEGLYLNHVGFSPDGALVATTDCHGAATLWDAATGALVRKLDASIDHPNAAVFTPDGAYVIVCGSDGRIAVHRASGEREHVWKAHGASASALSVSPDGALLASIGEDRTARVWRLADGASVATFTLAGSRRAVAFSPDDRYAVVLERPDVTVWDLERLAQQARWKVRAGTSLALAPDGASVAVGTTMRAAHLFALPDGAPLAKWTLPHGVTGQQLAYAPDGRRLLARDYSRVALLDAATGTTLAVVRGHLGMLSGATFTRDGRRLVTVSWDGTALVWDVPALVEAPAPPTKKPRAPRKRA